MNPCTSSRQLQQRLVNSEAGQVIQMTKWGIMLGPVKARPNGNLVHNRQGRVGPRLLLASAPCALVDSPVHLGGRTATDGRRLLPTEPVLPDEREADAALSVLPDPEALRLSA